MKGTLFDEVKNDPPLFCLTKLQIILFLTKNKNNYANIVRKYIYIHSIYIVY